jgi:hypothetical protein
MAPATQSDISDALGIISVGITHAAIWSILDYSDAGGPGDHEIEGRKRCEASIEVR